jgi:hypothetical protein
MDTAVRKNMERLRDLRQAKEAEVAKAEAVLAAEGKTWRKKGLPE